MKRLHSIAACALLAGGAAFAIVGCSISNHDHHHSSHIHLPSDDLPLTAYPLTNCVVSGKPIGTKPYTFVRTGQEVKLCCKKCLAEFNKTPDMFMAKIP